MNQDEMLNLIHIALSNKGYKSSIPKNSSVRVKYEPSGVCVKTYYLNTKTVGRRIYDEKGTLYWEYGLKDEKYHGNYYYFFEDSSIKYQCNYVDGRVEGIISQWSDRGELICISNFINGTGIDFWCQMENGKVELAEERIYKDGVIDGYLRLWISEGKLWKEAYYLKGTKHGVEREWEDDNLSSGYPKYYIKGKEVTKEMYVNESIKSNISAMDESANQPFRDMNKFYLAVRKCLTTKVYV